LWLKCSDSKLHFLSRFLSTVVANSYWDEVNSFPSFHGSVYLRWQQHIRAACYPCRNRILEQPRQSAFPAAPNPTIRLGIRPGFQAECERHQSFLVHTSFRVMSVSVCNKKQIRGQDSALRIPWQDTSSSLLEPQDTMRHANHEAIASIHAGQNAVAVMMCDQPFGSLDPGGDLSHHVI
jgi:hypothetical protein